MSEWPQPFWASILAGMGVILVVVLLFSPSPENVRLQALTVASSLVTGALGYIGGHAVGSKQVNPTNGSQPPTTK